jgi:hypothetical protein
MTLGTARARTLSDSGSRDNNRDSRSSDVQPLWLVEDVVRVARMAPSTLAEHCRRGRFPHRKLSFSRRLLFQPDEVKAFLANPGMRLETIKLDGGGRVVKAA